MNAIVILGEDQLESANGELVRNVCTADRADEKEEDGKDDLQGRNERRCSVQSGEHLRGMNEDVGELESSGEPTDPALSEGPAREVRSQARSDTMAGVDRTPLVEDADDDVPDEVGGDELHLEFVTGDDLVHVRFGGKFVRLRDVEICRAAADEAVDAGDEADAPGVLVLLGEFAESGGEGVHEELAAELAEEVEGDGAGEDVPVLGDGAEEEFLGGNGGPERRFGGLLRHVLLKS